MFTQKDKRPFDTFAEKHPIEAYDYNRIKFIDHVRTELPDVTETQIDLIIIEMRKEDNESK